MSTPNKPSKIANCFEFDPALNATVTYEPEEWLSAVGIQKYGILRQAGTDPRHIGYTDTTTPGTYECGGCAQPLFASDNKFHSGCGWPSFDEALPGAVLTRTDADGRRTEILCSKCHSHLGHVFEGERFTKKNVRHCVNSSSINLKEKKTEDNKE